MGRFPPTMSPITVEKTAEDSASKSLHVTVPVVRKRFGDAIRQTILEEVIRESWETAKSNESLKPITYPSIRNLKFEDGSPIEFELHVEVRPELKLERTGGFRIERRGSPRIG